MFYLIIYLVFFYAIQISYDSCYLVNCYFDDISILSVFRFLRVKWSCLPTGEPVFPVVLR